MGQVRPLPEDLAVDDAESVRIERYLYPRPPADVLAEAARAGLRNPAAQDWIRGDDLHAERPVRFKCGLHGGDTLRDRPVEVLNLDGADGKSYRVGQCRRCGRVFWGIKGERPKRRYPWE
jgi:hypothetical protein